MVLGLLIEGSCIALPWISSVVLVRSCMDGSRRLNWTTKTGLLLMGCCLSTLLSACVRGIALALAIAVSLFLGEYSPVRSISLSSSNLWSLVPSLLHALLILIESKNGMAISIIL